MKAWEHLLTSDRVSQLHALGMSRYGGGAASAAKEGCVEGSLGNAWTAELYQEESADRLQGLAFAGYLLFYFVRNHCFADGNKRVAWLATVAVLAELNLTLEASDDEAEAMILDVIAGTVTNGADVTRWLAPRLVALA